MNSECIVSTQFITSEFSAFYLTHTLPPSPTPLHASGVRGRAPEAECVFNPKSSTERRKRQTNMGIFPILPQLKSVWGGGGEGPFTPNPTDCRPCYTQPFTTQIVLLHPKKFVIARLDCIILVMLLNVVLTVCTAKDTTPRTRLRSKHVRYVVITILEYSQFFRALLQWECYNSDTIISTYLLQKTGTLPSHCIAANLIALFCCNNVIIQIASTLVPASVTFTTRCTENVFSDD